LYRLTYFSFYPHSSGNKQRFPGGFTHAPPVPQPVEQPVVWQHPRATSKDVHVTPGSEGGVTAIIGGVTAMIGGVTAIIGGVTAMIGGVTAMIGGVTAIIGGGVTAIIGGVTAMIGGGGGGGGGGGATGVKELLAAELSES
jgi:hypothetical protein